MEWYSIILIAVGLAMDVFAVSLGIGTTDTAHQKRAVFRLSFHFGLFQGVMALLGWLIGSTIVQFISQFDHWIAFALLAWVGGRMIKEGLNPDEESNPNDPSRGKMLMVLCVATSLDALAVGLSLAMVQVDIAFATLMIGFVSTALSIVGLAVGRKLSSVFGSRMEVLGGVILVIIGLRIVITHLMGA